MRIGVIGSGDVGQTLAEGLKKHGYEVRIGSRSPQKLAEFSAQAGIQAGRGTRRVEDGDHLVR